MTLPNRNLESRLPEHKIKIAAARTIREWYEIYDEILVLTLKDIEKQAPRGNDIFEKYNTSAKPRMRRVCRDFEVAGLTLTEEMEFEGPIIEPGQQPMWPDLSRPKITFFWPDGQELAFVNEEAFSATAFFIFWQAHQEPVLGAKTEDSVDKRIILPGSAEHKSYFDAKAKDIASGDDLE